MRLNVAWFVASSSALKLLDTSNSRMPEKEHSCDDFLSTCSSKITERIRRYMITSGCPGISVCVSYAGQIFYRKGFGYADVECLVPVHEDTVFRIASISKSITSLLVGRLLEQGKITLDEDARTYVPEFPAKHIDNVYAKIDLRSLMNHSSGIRGYHKSDSGSGQSDYPEMLLQTRYTNPLEACNLFKDDPLVHAPGQKYTYSTYAFTLLSAVIERVCSIAGPAFDSISPASPVSSSDVGTSTEVPKDARIDSQFSRLFSFLGLHHTSLEYHERITPFRASQYRRNAKGVLENTPMVDNSYKWAGGGILSTAPDLVRLANHLSYIYLDCIPTEGVVKRKTLLELWKVSVRNPESAWQPGLGWFLSRRSGHPITKPTTLPDRLYVAHSGGSVGGTTVLLLSLPCESSSERRQGRIAGLTSQISKLPPICVAVLCNLEDAPGMTDFAVALVELVTDCALLGRSYFDTEMDS